MAYFDQLLKGTPLRGLVIQGRAGYCAYLGVPNDHWISDMENLTFDCHGEITFRGFGDGDFRPEGWYWYGWDYQHLSDRPMDLDSLDDLPPELARMLQSSPGSAKNWTLDEVEHDLIDSAIALMAVLHSVKNLANESVKAAMSRSDEPPQHA